MSSTYLLGPFFFRISIKDIVFIWTQPETLFAAAALLDPQLLGGELPGSEEPAIADNSANELQQQSEATEDKPSTSSSLQTASEASSEAAQKSKLRYLLTSFFFLCRF